MSDEQKAFVPTNAERRADLARQEAELRAEIARRRKLRKIIAISVVLGAALVWLGVAVVRRVIARAEVRALLDAVRERGEPLVPADINPPRIPDDENAAVVLVEAHEQFKKTEKLNGRPLAEWLHQRELRNRRATSVRADSLDDLLAKVIATHGDTIRLLRKALGRPRFSSAAAGIQPLDASNASDTMSELLSASALNAVREGRQDEALADIALVFDIVSFQYNDVGKQSVFRLANRDKAALETLATIAAATRCRNKEARTVLQALDSVDFAKVATKVMVRRQADMAHRAEGLLVRWLAPSIEMRAAAAQLRYMAEAVAAARQPPWVGLDKIRSLTWPTPTPTAPGMAPATPELQLIASIVRARARRDVARVGLALELHRSEKGDYPNSLDALAPEFLMEVPPDPFTGKPLRYVKEEKGFVVYSVGANLTDDGGMPGTARSVLDIPWTGGKRVGGDGSE